MGGSEVRWVSGADRRSGRSVKAGEERGSRKSPVLQSEGPGTQGRVGDSGTTLPPVARMNACDRLSACPTPQPGVPRLHVHTPREENLSRVRCEAGRSGLRRLSVGVSPVRGGGSRAHPFLVEVAVLTTPGRNRWRRCSLQPDLIPRSPQSVRGLTLLRAGSAILGSAPLSRFSG